MKKLKSLVFWLLIITRPVIHHLKIIRAKLKGSVKIFGLEFERWKLLIIRGDIRKVPKKIEVITALQLALIKGSVAENKIIFSIVEC